MKGMCIINEHIYSVFRQLETSTLLETNQNSLIYNLIFGPDVIEN
jgi:hypothetical protein